MEPIQLTKNANLLSYVQAPIVLLDKNLTVVDLTREWSKRFSVERSDILKKSFKEIFPDILEQYQSTFNDVLNGATDQNIVPDYNQLPEKVAALVLNPLKDGYGQIIGIILEAKKGKTILNKKTPNKSDLDPPVFKSLMIGSWEYDIESKTIIITKSIQNLLGVNNLFLSFEQFSSFIPKKYATDLREKLLANELEEAQWQLDVPFHFEDSPSINSRITGRPKFQKGIPTKIIGIIEQLIPMDGPKTEVKEDNHDLEQELFNRAPIPMALLHLDTGIVRQSNLEFEQLMGLDKNGIKNHHFSNLVLLDTPLLRNMAQYRKKWDGKPFNICLKGPEKEEITMSLKPKVISTPHMPNMLMVALLPPLTEKKADKTKLVDHQSETLTNIVHMLAHDLKAQAANLSLLLNFIDGEVEEANKKDILTMLQKSSSKLTHSIKDLRELVTIRHQLKEKYTKIQVNDALYAAMEGLSGFIRQINAKILNEITDDTELYSVPSLFESVLMNLLAGILKLNRTDASSIVILKSKTENGHTIIQVEDNFSGEAFHEKKNLPGTKGFKPGTDFMDFSMVQYQMELLGGKFSYKKNRGFSSTYSLFFKTLDIV